MTGFLLKLIAVFSMLLDHTLKVLPCQAILMDVFGMSMKSSAMLLGAVAPLGRLAFPLFAFFIAEGCRHTRSPKKYVGRLLLFGLVSELPFRLALMRLPLEKSLSLWPPRLCNVFFTLALGALSCFACKALREKGQSVPALLPVLPLAVLAELLHTDYGFWGVLAVFAAYAVTSRKGQLLALGGVLTALYLIRPGVMLGYVIMWAFALSALVLLFFYNGERGRKLKWAFYIFYPAHLTALYFALYCFFPQLVTH